MSSEESVSLEEQVMTKATIQDQQREEEEKEGENNCSKQNSNEEMEVDNAIVNNNDDNNDNTSNDDTDSNDNDTESTKDDDNSNDDHDDNEDEETKNLNLITKALTFKDDGNEQFKNKQYTQASRTYKKGINLIKHLHNGIPITSNKVATDNNNNSGAATSGNEEQITSLLISLQSNLSMVYFKLENYTKSKEIANFILTKLDSTNPKAYYRRGVSNYKLKQIGNAKHDLQQALQYNPNDKSIMKEYRIVKKEYDALNQKRVKEREKQKKALARAFSSNDSNDVLYSDKEEELRLKQQKEKEKEIEQQKLKEKRKVDWENDCVQRMSNNEDVLTFEEYEKQIEEKEKEEEKARKRAKKEKEEEERRKRKEAAAQKKKEEEEDNSDDDDLLSERELQSLRGYKKTSDGRTTSYFTREQTEEEKKLLGSIAPKKLEPQQIPPTATTFLPVSNNVASTLQRLDSSHSSSSAWNQAGTWEEKDTSEWCNKTLQKFLKDSNVSISGNESSSYSAFIKEVKKLNGDASVAFVSGKKRYVFDYSVDLSYQIMICNSDIGDEEQRKTVAKGSLHLPDVSSTSISDEEIEVQIKAWNKSPNDVHEEKAIACRKALVDKVREQVFAFVGAFNAQY